MPLAERPDEPDELFQEPRNPDEPVKKLDPAGQEFFLRFDEMIAPRLTKEAASCYRGGKNRDQKVKFYKFIVRQVAEFNDLAEKLVIVGIR